MKILLTAILLATSFSIALAQTKEEVIRSYGFGSMSEAGQDAFYTYWFSNRIPRSESLLEMKNIYHDIFKSKLSPSDLVILDRYWDEQNNLYKKQVTERGERMFTALKCQRKSLDSLVNYYYPELLSFKDKITSVLSALQLESIEKFQHVGKRRLHQKRDEYFKYAKENYSQITPHIYDYEAFSFELIEYHPSISYYNSIGINSLDLDFVSSLPLNEYYSLYQEFELNLAKSLDECHANVPLSLFYTSDIEIINLENTKKNALLFMMQETGLFGPDSNASLERVFFLDTIDIDPTSSSALKIEEILQVDKIIKLGFQPSPIPFPNSLSFMRYDASSRESTEIVAYLLATTPELKEEILPTATTRGFQNVKQILNTPYPVYYAADLDADDSENRTSVSLSAFIFRKSDILLIMINFINKGQVKPEELEKKILAFIQPISFN